MYKKDFDTWSSVKKRVDTIARHTNIRSGEIRWVSVGVNVGSEIDGKGVSFTRPCLVLHVIGHKLALVVPFTSQAKANEQFYQFIQLKHFSSYLCLSQMRVVSQNRIYGRIIKLPQNVFQSYKQTVFGFYNKSEA